MVKQTGSVVQGNTRVSILQERGVDVDVTSDDQRDPEAVFANILADQFASSGIGDGTLRAWLRALPAAER